MSKRTRPWMTVLVLVLTLAVVVPTTLAQTLVPGARGQAVAGLQRGLQALGYSTGPVDGVFGSRTEAAVRSFQRDAVIKVDGLAGPVTLGALDQFLARGRAARYTVNPGDSLYKIAARFHTGIAAIQELNGLRGEGLDVGQVLLIPVAVRPVHLTARRGGNLVLGYYDGDTPTSLRSLQRAGDSLDVVAAFAYHLGGDGHLSGEPFPDLMNWAAAADKPVLALVHNASSSGFIGAEMAALLTNTAARERAVEAIYAELVAGGYAGVHLDLENIPAPLRDYYSSFVAQVADRLRPAGLLTTAAVPARTGGWEVWFDAYDYGALGATCDLVAIMAYDQHSPDSRPGPVAGQDWLQAVAAYAAAHIPAERLLLGMAAYGYDWSEGMPGAQALSASGAASLAARYGAEIAWSDSAQVPWFRYWSGGAPHIVYYENAWSLAAKLTAANAGAGIALWRLGLEDPAIWQTLATARAKAAVAAAPPIAAGAAGQGRTLLH